MSAHVEGIDRSLAAGPPTPQDSVRPLVTPRRYLTFRGAAAHMVDVVSGDTRPWENGPPVVVPLVSSEFDISAFAWLQVQIARDRRELSRNSALFDLVVGEVTVAVRSSAAGSLVIDDGSTTAIGPIGESPDIVVRFAYIHDNDDEPYVRVSARNAGTLSEILLESGPVATTAARLAVGGTVHGESAARRRTSPVHVHTAPNASPADPMRQTIRRVRRVAGTLRDRIT